MRAAIFYGSRVKLTNAHKAVHHATKPPTGEAQPPYFVRMVVRNMSMEDALDKAKPMVGETVLNSVEL